MEVYGLLSSVSLKEPRDLVLLKSARESKEKGTNNSVEESS